MTQIELSWKRQTNTFSSSKDRGCLSLHFWPALFGRCSTSPSLSLSVCLWYPISLCLLIHSPSSLFHPFPSVFPFCLSLPFLRNVSEQDKRTKAWQEVEEEQEEKEEKEKGGWKIVWGKGESGKGGKKREEKGWEERTTVEWMWMLSALSSRADMQHHTHLGGLHQPPSELQHTRQHGRRWAILHGCMSRAFDSVLALSWYYANGPPLDSSAETFVHASVTFKLGAWSIPSFWTEHVRKTTIAAVMQTDTACAPSHPKIVFSALPYKVLVTLLYYFDWTNQWGDYIYLEKQRTWLSKGGSSVCKAESHRVPGSIPNRSGKWLGTWRGASA